MVEGIRIGKPTKGQKRYDKNTTHLPWQCCMPRLSVRFLLGGRKPENRLYTGIYEYTVDGVIRTNHLVLSGMKPPHTLYFYYISSPKHVFSEYDIRKNPLKILLYIIPVLVAFVVMTALGFRP